jgi:NAD(P)-dependent dehydrogenase (short-subunit alcohol dehydrogenase family)
MAAELLVGQGHQVVLHARSADRAADARRQLRQSEAVVIGDLETIAGVKGVAAQVNALGHFDAMIHNAAVGYREGHHVTADDLPHVFAINTLSVYILTALIERPKRLVYLSSGMHHHADAHVNDILWQKRHWNGSQAYAESKLHDVMGSLCLRETPFYRAPHLHRVPRRVFQGPDQVRGTSDYARG